MREAEGGLRALGRTCDAMRRLHSQGEQMQRVASLLEVSGYGFAVESARGLASQHAFSAFVTELRRLAAKVATLGEAIADQAKSAQDESERLGRTTTASLAELGQLTERADATVRQTSARVESVLSASWTALQEAERDTARIVAHAADAVYHLQFGDIVRQKLEHVAEAFEEVAPEDGEHVLSVQAGQLELVGEEIESARQHLDEAFAGLAEGTRRLAGTIGHLGGKDESGKTGRDPLAELRAAFTDMERLLRHASELCAGARASSARATETARHFSRYLAEVEEINQQMHLQALNAVIKTVLLGNEGRTLEILSMHVQRLFEESNDLVAETAGVIGSFGADGSACAAGAGTPEDTPAALHNDLDELARVQDEFQRAMRAAAEEGDRQKAALSQARISLGLLSELGEDVAALRREVAAVRLRTSGAVAAAEAGIHSKAISRYTIASEREVHRRVTKAAQLYSQQEGTPSAAMPEDDGINPFLDPPRPETVAPEERGLGENVELF
jgi:hypothetical protein